MSPRTAGRPGWNGCARPGQRHRRGLLGALDRLQQVRDLGVTGLDLTGIPAGRIDQLARYAAAAPAQAVSRLAEPRRTATLLQPPVGSGRRH